MVAIKKAWTFDDSQTIFIYGKKYNIHAAVFAARGLPVVEIPMEHMNFSTVAPCHDNFRSFVEHVKMVNEADLSFPILLNQDGAIIDGKHRLAKALLEGRSFILAQRFPTDPPAIYTEV